MSAATPARTMIADEAAAAAFDQWWDSIGHAERCQRDPSGSWDAFREGWFSMARELGHQALNEFRGEFVYVPLRKRK